MHLLPHKYNPEESLGFRVLRFRVWTTALVVELRKVESRQSRCVLN